MKCVVNLKENMVVKRVKDKKAHEMVDSGKWVFTAKCIYKKYLKEK